MQRTSLTNNVHYRNYVDEEYFGPVVPQNFIILHNLENQEATYKWIPIAFLLDQNQKCMSFFR